MGWNGTKILTIHDRDSTSNKWEKKTVDLGATFSKIAMSPDKQWLAVGTQKITVLNVANIEN